MTAFTVGHTVNYDEALAASLIDGKPMRKCGPFKMEDGTDYNGGIIFKTPEDAAAYLIQIGKTEVWSVYEIDADYDADTWRIPGEQITRLKRDALVIRKFAE